MTRHILLAGAAILTLTGCVLPSSDDGYCTYIGSTAVYRAPCDVPKFTPGSSDGDGGQGFGAG